MFLQDSDWEEVDAEDAEVQQSFLHASPAKLSGKPDYEHLAAMAKVFEVLFSQFFLYFTVFFNAPLFFKIIYIL